MRPLILVFALALATPGILPAQDETDSTAFARAESAEDRRAGNRARMWSLAGTLAPYVLAPALAGGRDPGAGALMLMGGGFYFGPALGYWVEGASARGWMGVGIRFGVVMGAVGVMAALTPDHPYSAEEPNGPRATTASVAMMLGALGAMGSSVYDIVVVPRHVRSARAAKRSGRQSTSLGLVPIMDAPARRAGLQARITF